MLLKFQQKVTPFQHLVGDGFALWTLRHTEQSQSRGQGGHNNMAGFQVFLS